MAPQSKPRAAKAKPEPALSPDQDGIAGPPPGETPAAAPEPATAAKPRPPAKYPPEVVEAARRANELRSHQAKRIGPKQAERMLERLRAQTAVRAEDPESGTIGDAAAELTAELVVKLSGARSVKHLRDIAAGRGTREDGQALKPLTGAIKDQYVQGQWGAALLAAWAEVLKEAKP